MPYRNPVSFTYTPPLVRGYDYFQWDPISTDPTPFTLGSGAAYSSFGAYPAIQINCGSSGNKISSRVFPVYGYNNVDGLFHNLELEMEFNCGGNVGSSAQVRILVDDLNNVGAQITAIGSATPTLDVSFGGGSPVNLTPNTWYTLKMVINSTGFTLYYKISTSTTYALIGSSSNGGMIRASDIETNVTISSALATLYVGPTVLTYTTS